MRTPEIQQPVGGTPCRQLGLRSPSARTQPNLRRRTQRPAAAGEHVILSGQLFVRHRQVRRLQGLLRGDRLQPHGPRPAARRRRPSGDGDPGTVRKPVDVCRRKRFQFRQRRTSVVAPGTRSVEELGRLDGGSSTSEPDGVTDIEPVRQPSRSSHRLDPCRTREPRDSVAGWKYDSASRRRMSGSTQKPSTVGPSRKLSKLTSGEIVFRYAQFGIVKPR